MKVFIVDNYDSFTFNLVHIIEDILDQDVVVKRNDCFDLDEIENYTHIVLSPGPGLPSEAGLMPELVKRYGPSKKILGVCLGHQCIGEVYGASLENLSKVVHGKGVETIVTRKEEPIYSGMPERVITGRYHSWVVSSENFPDCLEVTSKDEQGYIMSLRHKEHEVVGVQYHPESVLTPDGRKLLENWLK